MKIVHIITRLILGGAQENTILTCEGLHRRGHEVTLITGPALGPEGQLLDRAKRGGYRVILLDAMRRAIHVRRDWSSYRALKRELAVLSPDVMHSHSSKAGILARQAAGRVGVPNTVHTIHALPFHPYQARWLNALYVLLERRAARQSTALISVADAMTAQALAAGVGQPGQYTTIYSGMEIGPFLDRPAAADAFRACLNLPADAILVTQVSRLAELKGHEYLLAAAQSLPASVHFCLVGDGALRGRIESAIDRQGLRPRFHLTGLVDPGRIPAILHATDILVHCSLREGLARALPQAMLAAKPVVSFDVDGAREVVLPGQTGYLVPPRDVPALAAALAELAADAPLRARLGAAGRQFARQRFDAKTMVDQIERLYLRLAEQAGRSLARA
jgi:glycosyltransferase involved in cell wall biosynthesis